MSSLIFFLLVFIITITNLTITTSQLSTVKDIPWANCKTPANDVFCFGTGSDRRANDIAGQGCFLDSSCRVFMYATANQTHVHWYFYLKGSDVRSSFWITDKTRNQIAANINDQDRGVPFDVPYLQVDGRPPSNGLEMVIKINFKGVQNKTGSIRPRVDPSNPTFFKYGNLTPFKVSVAKWKCFEYTSPGHIEFYDTSRGKIYETHVFRDRVFPNILAINTNNMVVADLFLDKAIDLFHKINPLPPTIVTQTTVSSTTPTTVDGSNTTAGRPNPDNTDGSQTLPANSTTQSPGGSTSMTKGESGKGNTGIIVAVVIILLLVVGGAVGGYYYLNSKKTKSKAKATQAEVIRSKISKLDSEDLSKIKDSNVRSAFQESRASSIVK